MGLVIWFLCVLYSSIRNSTNSTASKLSGADLMLAKDDGTEVRFTRETPLGVLHRVAVTWIPKVRWTFDEIPKMSPGGARTHDPAATLSKLQPNLGIQVTATRCTRDVDMKSVCPT